MKTMQFNDFILRPEIFQTLESIQFDTPTEIQKKVIPLALKKRDIIGMSQTGSGKTHAYLIPIFNAIKTEENRVQSVIIVPTRELAMQVFQMTKSFQSFIPDARITLLSGGFERTKHLQTRDSVPHIIIGTPGRIKDIAFDANAFRITDADILVLDEADMVFASGFFEDIHTIAGKMKSDLQMMVFSATLPNQLQNFLDKYMKNPQLINLNQATPNPSGVSHIAYPTRNRDRFSVLLQLLSGINPFIAIIFVSEKKHMDDLYKRLVQSGMKVGMLHGDLDSTTRKVTLKRIQNSEFQYILASDIVARGLDIEGVSHIINYSLPYEEEFYFHRAGRTGRAGQTGYCYTLYDREEMDKLQSYMGKGVRFLHQEFRDGIWIELKKLGKPQKKKKDHPVNEEIKKIIRRTEKQKVKPGYKKKMREEIDKVKRKHRHSVIEADIKKKIVKRAKEKKKEIKSVSEGEL